MLPFHYRTLLLNTNQKWKGWKCKKIADPEKIINLQEIWLLRWPINFRCSKNTRIRDAILFINSIDKKDSCRFKICWGERRLLISCYSVQHPQGRKYILKNWKCCKRNLKISNVKGSRRASQLRPDQSVSEWRALVPWLQSCRGPKYIYRRV